MSEVDLMPDVVAPTAAQHKPSERSATRYRGANIDIDDVTLMPDGLWVRGKNLNDLICRADFETALWHLWHETDPTNAEHRKICARLTTFGRFFSSSSVAVRIAATVAGLGVDMVIAAATGLMRGTEDAIAYANFQSGDAEAQSWDRDFDQMLACIAGAPYLMRAALGEVMLDIEPAANHSSRMLYLAGGTTISQTHSRVMDALLTAGHTGFGYVAPAVLVPRCVIGSGVTLSQAIAAGFMASGPDHVGGALKAMQWLRSLAEYADHESAKAVGAVDALLKDPHALLFAFDHPLLVADPRPPHIRALFAEWNFGGVYLTMFDVVCARAKECRDLNSNIDFITAAALLDLGVTEPRWSVGVGLCARIAAMAAHAVERRQRSAPGANNAHARKLLAAAPAG